MSNGAGIVYKNAMKQSDSSLPEADEPDTAGSSEMVPTEPLRDVNPRTAGCVPRSVGVVVTTLAELPDRALVDERALSAALCVSKRTVRRMVARHELPPPVRFAGRSTWQVGRVLAWFEARADRLARDAQRAARSLHDTENRLS